MLPEQLVQGQASFYCDLRFATRLAERMHKRHSTLSFRIESDEAVPEGESIEIMVTLSLRFQVPLKKIPVFLDALRKMRGYRHSQLEF